MNENELNPLDDAASDSTLTEENIQDQDLEESESEPSGDTVEIDGVEYTREELAELVSKGKDYTQKRQAEAEELRQLKAQVEALASSSGATEEMSPAEWLENELGYAPTDEGTILANALNVILTEINSLKGQISPVLETQKLSAAEQSVSAMLKPHGLQVNSDQIRAALKAAGGDEAKAALSLALGAKPQGSPKRTPPASQTPGNPAKIRDLDPAKMTEEQMAEWRKDIMNSVS